MTWRIHEGDALTVLRGMPAESFNACVTSPPYWGLRDYGTARWEGGDSSCEHKGRPKPRQDTSGGGPDKGRFAQTRGTQAAKAIHCIPVRDVCRCGARRVDLQLGLEETPDLFVARLVEVFREVRRVLRSDGTLWLNLGDCYARTSALHGLKSKDLVGIPWMVAMALRAPYYAGRIKDARDRLWLAALVDTEGCIHVHRRAAGTSAHSSYTRKDGSTANYLRTADTYGVMVSVDNTSEAIIDRCAKISGQGSRYTHAAGVGKANRRQTLYRWTVTGYQARELLRELYPDLVAKQQQARIAYWAPSSGELASAAHIAIKALHAGRSVSVDSEEPPTLFEPGWYLRSGVIWGKLNPMPESVTDRPTKAHEDVFLLSKSPRYYFDGESIAEPATGRAPGNVRPTAFTEADPVRGRTAANLHKIEARETRNARTVWTMSSQPFSEAHFATFPPELARRCVLSACPPGGTVLDPFAGAGTTLMVAARLGRNAEGIELNPEYAALARRRIQADAPLFNIGSQVRA